MRTARRRELIFQNAHHAQARAPFCQYDGAHDHVSKQNEHRAAAGAPFSVKMCTTRRREAQKCSSGAAKMLPLSGAHPTNQFLVQPDVRAARQGAAK